MVDIITQTNNAIPSISVEQMKIVDKVVVQDFKVPILSLMENAGQKTAVLARQMLGGDVQGKKILVLAYKGHNGADALVSARHLTNFGAQVHCIIPDSPKDLGPETRMQYDMLNAQQVKMTVFNPEQTKELTDMLLETQLVIDGILGYSLDRQIEEPLASLIRTADLENKPILSVDIPSGLDANTGDNFDPCISATATITMGLPKHGIVVPKAESFVGAVYVADIGIPWQAYQQIGIAVPWLFAQSGLVRLK